MSQIRGDTWSSFLWETFHNQPSLMCSSNSFIIYNHTRQLKHCPVLLIVVSSMSTMSTLTLSKDSILFPLYSPQYLSKGLDKQHIMKNYLIDETLEIFLQSTITQFSNQCLLQHSPILFRLYYIPDLISHSGRVKGIGEASITIKVSPSLLVGQ